MRISDWSSYVCSSDLQPPTFLRRQVPPHLDDPLDAVDLAFLRLAGCAVLGVNLPVRKGDPRPLEREALALGVEPEGHRGAGAERRQPEIVWRRAHVEAADELRLGGGEAMRSERDVLGELRLAGLLDHHSTDRGSWCGPERGRAACGGGECREGCRGG